MNNRVLKYNKFSLNNFKFDDVVTNGKTSKINVTYTDEIGNGPLMIQLPEEMRIPFDLVSYDKEITDKNGNNYNLKSYYINFNFNLNNEKHTKCIKILKKFDNFLLNIIEKNANKLFKKQPTFTGTDNNNFTGILAQSRDKTTNNIDGNYIGLKLKVPHKKDKLISKVYNVNRELVDTQVNLVKGNIGGPIIKINNLWASGTKYGVSCDLQLFKMQEVKIEKNNNKEYLFLSDSDDSD